MECGLEDDGVDVLPVADDDATAAAAAATAAAEDAVGLAVAAVVVCCVDKAMVASDFVGGDLNCEA